MASGFSFHIFLQMRFLWSFHNKLNLQLSQIRPTLLTHGEMPLLVFLTRFSVLLAGSSGSRLNSFDAKKSTGRKETQALARASDQRVSTALSYNLASMP